MKRLVLGLWLAASAPVWSAVAPETACRLVTPGENLQAALDAAPRKGCLKLAAGVYAGPVTMGKPLTLTAEKGAVIRGGDRAVTIAASRVTLENLTIEGTGRTLSEAHAAVWMKKFAHDVSLVRVTLKSPAFGFYGEGVGNVKLTDCVIEGDKSRPVTSRGDGVYVKSAQNVEVVRSQISDVRDGVYFESTESSSANYNRLEGLQYGIHFMYAKGVEAHHNRVRHSAGGIAVMSTRHVSSTGNLVTDGTEFGALLNVASGCVLTNNTFSRIRNPEANAAVNSEGKGVFIYGPGVNDIAANLIEQNDIGIDVAVGVEENRVYDNVITGNDVPVRYVGVKPLVWTFEDGNFWGEGVVPDLDGDGYGDEPYQPNDSLDRLFWIYPEARFLAESPVVMLLRRLTKGLALDKGKGITDERPITVRPRWYGAPEEELP